MVWVWVMCGMNFIDRVLRLEVVILLVIFVFGLRCEISSVFLVIFLSVVVFGLCMVKIVLVFFRDVVSVFILVLVLVKFVF